MGAPLLQPAAFPGQRQLQFPGNHLRVFKKHFIKIAQTVKKDTVAVFLFLFPDTAASWALLFPHRSSSVFPQSRYCFPASGLGSIFPRGAKRAIRASAVFSPSMGRRSDAAGISRSPPRKDTGFFTWLCRESSRKMRTGEEVRLSTPDRIASSRSKPRDPPVRKSPWPSTKAPVDLRRENPA